MSSSKSGVDSFRGFADFAHTDFEEGSTTANATLAVARVNKDKATKSTRKASNPNQQSSKKNLIASLTKSPIYTGNDALLASLFRKIGQKRDPVTKVRALEELMNIVYPSSNSESGVTRHEKIVVLSHLIYLHESKLGHDNHSSVRAASYAVLTAARTHIPKAWELLLSPDDVSRKKLGVLGMAWGASRDDAMEVAKNASLFIEELVIADKASTKNSKTQGALQVAIFHHFAIVLKCKCSSLFQEIINPTSLSNSFLGLSQRENDEDKKNKSKKGIGGGGGAFISQSEQEEIEERYERSVLHALKGIGWLFECFPEKDTTPIKYATDTCSIVRFLTSSRGSFRRETYSLMGQICQFAPSLLDSIGLGDLIPNALRSENEPSNLFPLLEMILYYLTKAGSKGDPWSEGSIDSVKFTKSLNKALQHGCYGANALSWGPTILPIVASLPMDKEANDNKKKSQPLPLLVVFSLWEGRRSVGGITDTIAIASAVAECATFLLLHRGQVTVLSVQSWKSCGLLFLKVLSFYLFESPGVGLSASSDDGLSETLARCLIKLDAASQSADVIKSIGINAIKSWFWGEEGLKYNLSSKKITCQRSVMIDKLNTLLKKLLSLPGDKSFSHLTPAFKILFHSVASSILPYQKQKSNASGRQLLLSILQFCGGGGIFSKYKILGVGVTKSIELFCINDIKRWIILHASATSSSIIETDFQILKLCLNSMQKTTTRRKEIWVMILQELIRFSCNYTSLGVGLRVLLGDEDKSVMDMAGLVSCEVLDKFALFTAEQLIRPFRHKHVISRHNNDNDEIVVREISPMKRQGDVSLFLAACSGLTNDGSSNSQCLLVSTAVIHHWIDLCSERRRQSTKFPYEDKTGNILLKTVLSFASCPHGTKVILHDDLVHLIYESWFEGGKAWDISSTKYFGSAASETQNIHLLREQFILCASSSLVNDIESNAPTDHALLELVCQAWANRVSRLIGIHPSLGLIGLGSLEVWDKALLREDDSQSEFLFLCLMYVLHSIDSGKHRRDLLFNNQETALFAHIQTSITKSDTPHLLSFQSRTSRNSQLIETIGFPDALGETLLENTCMDCICLLSSHMRDGTLTEINRAITSVSFFVSILFPVGPNTNIYSSDKFCDVLARDIKEGDIYWYDKKLKQCERVKATVVGIHEDDFPNLYFTIKEAGSSGEIQTDANRLKKISTMTQSVCDSERRDRIGRCIFANLIKPFFGLNKKNAVGRAEGVAESINIIISQCRLVSFGIGSVRYEIFQALSSVERDLCNTLSMSKASLRECNSLLRCLSRAMGYGVYSMPSFDNASLLKMGPFNSVDKLLDLYENQTWLDAEMVNPTESFHSNVLMWLSTTVSVIKDGCTVQRIFALINSVCEILAPLDSSFSLKDSLHVMNAIRLLQASDVCWDSSTVKDKEEHVLFKLVHCFVNLGQDNTGFWIEIFLDLLHEYCNNSSATLLPVVTSFSDRLCDCLYDPLRRRCAFQLLGIFAKNSQPLQLGNEFDIPPKTRHQLSVWRDELEEGEAVGLVENVSVASQWLPAHMMALFQNVESITSDPRRPHLMGHLLLWIVSLDILDASGSVDMRNRSHISTYIQKTNALGYMLKIAMQESELDSPPGKNIFACMDCNSKTDFLMEEVATLAVFRTVESLPTLVKTWYNDDCPRFLRQKLCTFVQRVVAPVTLKRELIRIKEATSFGEMTISGSCVSREIVATYNQDECQLSVMVKMPSCFPLRNVEVDCQKTIGIPESRWRRWALQIMLLLNNQDCSVLDSLLLWKKNVDKEFDGVEPCPVCYSVLCIKTHQMPNLECKTCHNKFHSTCLMKWFQSSGKSQCVLCQQPWSRS